MLLAWGLCVLGLAFGGALGLRALFDPKWAARLVRLKADEQGGGQAEFRATYGGVFFLGFGGSRWTSDMAINYYKTVLGVAAQLMAMVLLVGIGKTFLDDYYARMSEGINLKEMGVMLIVCVILLALVNKIPALIAGVITFVLHPQAAALQAQAFASKGEDARKAAFEAFFQLHKPVRVLYILNVGLGIALLTLRVRSWIRVKE